MMGQSTPPPLVPRPLWRVVLAWGIILVCVAVAGGVMGMAGRNGRKNPSPPAGVEAVPPQNIALKLSARYAVGLVSLQEPSDSRDRLVEKLLAQLQANIHTPADQLRLVMIVSQLQSPQAAGNVLQSLGTRILTPDAWQDADTLRLLFRQGSASVPDELRQRLLDRYGWYARLALSSDLPVDSVDRQAALGPAIRGAVGAIVLFMGIGTAILAGIGLLVVLVIRMVNGQHPPTAFAPTVWDGGYFLEAMAFYLLGMVLLPLGIRHWWPNIGVNGTWLVAPVVVLAVVWPVMRGLRWSMVRRQLGWTLGRGFWREVGAGILGWCAGLPIIVLGVIATWALSRYSHAPAIHPIVYEVAGDGWKLAGIYLLACVWAPITEETMFRGALYQHLRGRWNWIISAIVVGLIFAALHPQGWIAIPVLGTIGAVLAVIREWRGSLIASMTAHLLVNAMTVTLLVLLLH